MRYLLDIRACKKGAVGAAAALLLLSLATSANAAPSDGGGDSDEGSLAGLSDATAEDVAFEARTSGRPVSEIAAEITYQENVDAAIDPIISKYDSSYSEAGYTSRGTAYVVFKGPIADSDLQALRKVSGLTVRLDGVYSSAEADDAMEKVATVVNEALPDGEASMVHVSPTDGKAVIATSTPLSTQAKSEVQEKLAKPQNKTFKSNGNSAPAVNFEVDQTLDAEAATVNGGDKLTRKNSTTPSCTAAFPAKSGGHRGLLTAGHCPNSLTVDRGNQGEGGPYGGYAVAPVSRVR